MIAETRRQLMEKLEARTMERDVARDGCATFLEQRDNAIKMLNSIAIDREDTGMFLLRFKVAAGEAVVRTMPTPELHEFKSRLELARASLDTH